MSDKERALWAELVRLVARRLDQELQLHLIATAFWRKVAVGAPGECWHWRGLQRARGYGRVKCGGREMPAHRFAYILVNGVVPPGVPVRQLCGNPACVNPAHLFVLSRASLAS